MFLFAHTFFLPFPSPTPLACARLVYPSSGWHAVFCFFYSPFSFIISHMNKINGFLTLTHGARQSLSGYTFRYLFISQLLNAREFFVFGTFLLNVSFYLWKKVQERVTLQGQKCDIKMSLKSVWFSRIFIVKVKSKNLPLIKVQKSEITFNITSSCEGRNRSKAGYRYTHNKLSNWLDGIRSRWQQTRKLVRKDHFWNKMTRFDNIQPFSSLFHSFDCVNSTVFVITRKKIWFLIYHSFSIK